MAADLQEPPALIASFFEILGSGRAISYSAFAAAGAIPGSPNWCRTFSGGCSPARHQGYAPGGVDVFGCSASMRPAPPASGNQFPSELFHCSGSASAANMCLQRAARLEGKSAWTTSKKLRHGLNSIFSLRTCPSACCSTSIHRLRRRLHRQRYRDCDKLRGDIPVPGYTPIVLASLFFGALTSLGFGIVGQYLWLALRARIGVRIHHPLRRGAWPLANPGGGTIVPESLAESFAVLSLVCGVTHAAVPSVVRFLAAVPPGDWPAAAKKATPNACKPS